MLLEAKLQKTFFVIQRASKGQLTHNAIALAVGRESNVVMPLPVAFYWPTQHNRAAFLKHFFVRVLRQPLTDNIEFNTRRSGAALAGGKRL